MRLGLAFAAAASLFLIAPVVAQGPTDPARVAASAGIRLPERLCALNRHLLASYGEGVRANYQVTGGIVDIFVTQVTQPLAEEFTQTEEIIGRLHANLTVVRELAGPPGVAGVMGRLWRGELPSGPVVTGLLLWHRDNWRIKLRATVAAAEADRSWPEIECAIRALALPRAT